jgi:hypothetical protein
MEINKIFKPKRFDNFTIVPNIVFRIKNISLSATGLYSYLFSHDENNPITITYLQGHFKESYKAIKARLEELEKHNLLRRERIRYNGKFAGFNYYLHDGTIVQKDNTIVQKDNCQKDKENNNNNIINIVKKQNAMNENSMAYKSLNHFIELFPKKYHPKTDAQKFLWYETLDKIERLDKYDLRDVFKICNVLRQDNFWSGNFLSLRKLRQKDKNGIRYVDRFMDKYNRATKPNCYYKVNGIEEYFIYVEDKKEKLGAVTHNGTLNAYNLQSFLNFVEYDILLKYAKSNKK